MNRRKKKCQTCSLKPQDSFDVFIFVSSWSSGSPVFLWMIQVNSHAILKRCMLLCTVSKEHDIAPCTLVILPMESVLQASAQFNTLQTFWCFFFCFCVDCKATDYWSIIASPSTIKQPIHRESDLQNFSSYWNYLVAKVNTKELVCKTETNNNCEFLDSFIHNTHNV